MTLWMTELSGFRGLYPTSDSGARWPWAALGDSGRVSWAALGDSGRVLHRTGVLRADVGFAVLWRGPDEGSPAVFSPAMRVLSRAIRSWAEPECTLWRYAKVVPRMGPCKFDRLPRQSCRTGGSEVAAARQGKKLRPVRAGEMGLPRPPRRDYCCNTLSYGSAPWLFT